MQANMHQAKTQLSRLTELALAGEDVIIAKAGKPLVKLVPVEAVKTDRVPGTLRGKVKLPPDEVWFERDEEIERLFYDGPLEP